MSYRLSRDIRLIASAVNVSLDHLLGNLATNCMEIRAESWRWETDSNLMPVSRKETVE